MKLCNVISNTLMFALLVSCAGSGQRPEASPPIAADDRRAEGSLASVSSDKDLILPTEVVVATCDHHDHCHGKRFPTQAIALRSGTVLASTDVVGGDDKSTVVVPGDGSTCYAPIHCTSFVVRESDEIWCIRRWQGECREIDGPHALVGRGPAIAYSSDSGRSWHVANLDGAIFDLVAVARGARDEVFVVGADGQVWAAAVARSNHVRLRRLGSPPPGSWDSHVAFFSERVVCIKRGFLPGERFSRSEGRLFCSRTQGKSWVAAERNELEQAASGPVTWWAIDANDMVVRSPIELPVSVERRWVPLDLGAGHRALTITVVPGGQTAEVVVLGVVGSGQVISSVASDGRLVGKIPVQGLRVTSLDAAGGRVAVSALEGVFVLEGGALRRATPSCGVP